MMPSPTKSLSIPNQTAFNLDEGLFLDLDLATKSLNPSGDSRTPHSSVTIATGAILMLIIIGIDKTFNKTFNKTLNKSSQEPEQPASDAPLSNEDLEEDQDFSFESQRPYPPRSVGPRVKKPFPNSASCCPIPPNVNTNNTWSDPVTGEVFTLTQATDRKRVRFADVHVRELEWEPDHECCEHGVPETWHCTIGTHYTYSVDAAEVHRMRGHRLHKQEYCWTYHKRCGPKAECECCHAPAEPESPPDAPNTPAPPPEPSTPPPAPPSSPETKGLLEKAASENTISMGNPDNVMAVNSRAKAMTEMYIKEKLKFFE